MSPPECVVVMPVFNEEGCILAVCRDWLAVIGELGEIGEIGGARLVVVDDGSTDRTGELLAALAGEDRRLEVLRQDNAGHGAAVLRGLAAAVASRPAWIAQSDSDDEIAAAEFLRLWRRRSAGPFLLGRRRGRDDAWPRRAASRCYRWIARLLFGAAPEDPNSPFRLIRGELLADLLARLPPGPFAPNSLTAILAAAGGAAPVEIPVAFRRRRSGRSSLRGFTILEAAWRAAGDLWRLRRQRSRQEAR